MLTSKIYVVFNLPPHHWGCTGTLPLRGWPFVVHHDRHIDLCPGYYLLSILEPHLFLELHAVTWRTCRLCFIHIYDLCIFRSDIWSYNDIYIYIYILYILYMYIYIYIHIYICLLHVLPLNKIHSNISASFSPSFFWNRGLFFRSFSFQGVPTSRCDLWMANTSPVASLFRVLETEMSLEGGDF